MFTAQTLPTWKRAVLKVGRSLLAADGGSGLSPWHAEVIAGFVAAVSHSDARGCLTPDYTAAPIVDAYAAASHEQ